MDFALLYLNGFLIQFPSTSIIKTSEKNGFARTLVSTKSNFNYLVAVVGQRTVPVGQFQFSTGCIWHAVPKHGWQIDMFSGFSSTTAWNTVRFENSISFQRFCFLNHSPGNVGEDWL